MVSSLTGGRSNRRVRLYSKCVPRTNSISTVSRSRLCGSSLPRAIFERSNLTLRFTAQRNRHSFITQRNNQAGVRRVRSARQRATWGDTDSAPRMADLRFQLPYNSTTIRYSARICRASRVQKSVMIRLLVRRTHQARRLTQMVDIYDLPFAPYCPTDGVSGSRLKEFERAFGRRSGNNPKAITRTTQA